MLTISKAFFYGQGHDTITSGLSFVLYEIANHPEIQEKIYDEICSVFGEDFKEHFDSESIKNLRYLEQVVKEGLRLYPSVPSYQRELTEDEQIGEKINRKYSTKSVIFTYETSLLSKNKKKTN